MECPDCNEEVNKKDVPHTCKNKTSVSAVASNDKLCALEIKEYGEMEVMLNGTYTIQELKNIIAYSKKLEEEYKKSAKALIKELST